MIKHNAIAASLALALTASPAMAQPQMDLMQMADSDSDGEVTLEEYTSFSEQGWGFVSQGEDKVKVSDLDEMAQMAFFGIEPDADGYITRDMYMAAIPQRFEMFDADGSGTLNSDELNGRAFQQ